MLALSVALLLATNLTGAGDNTKITDYIFAKGSLANLGKDFETIREIDPSLKKILRPNSAANAILMRVKKEAGKVTEIELWYSTNDRPEIERVRLKPFTQADTNDFKKLMLALGLTQ